MTYLKCVSCRARLYSDAAQDDVDGDSCPGCGGTLEPVGELAEIVGYHSIGPRGDGDRRWLDGTALRDLVLPGSPRRQAMAVAEDGGYKLNREPAS